MLHNAFFPKSAGGVRDERDEGMAIEDDQGGKKTLLGRDGEGKQRPEKKKHWGEMEKESNGQIKNMVKE